MQILLLQHAIENMQPGLNRSRARDLIQGAAIRAPSLIVLPELFSTGIIPDGFASLEAKIIEDEDRAFLADMARATHAHVLGTTVGSEKDALLNLSVLFDPNGNVACEYRKIHPFSMGGEDRVFQAGDTSVTYALAGFILQPAICYDLRFPELFRAGLKRGTTLVAVQANWPAARQTHWETLLRARAIENQCFVIGVNCVGVQKGLRYAGGSMIVSPKGETVASLGAEAGVAMADISPQQVETWRKAFPVLRDRKEFDA